MAAPVPLEEKLNDHDSSTGDIVKISRAVRAVRNAATYQRTGRTVVICLDGTGDQFDADNSNIVHLMSCLKKSDPTQVTYYQSGIGTYDGKGMTGSFNSAADAAVGSGLGVHVRDAYMFLMANYKEGDKICIFGFSRGAYTARCVAGMVHKVGLLPAHNAAQVPFAYRFYKDDTKNGWKMSEEFKKTFCQNVDIYFLGCFDSVASVGFIPRKLPLSSTPKNKATYFRHAMSLDEHRAKFKVCRFKARLSTDSAEGWKVLAEMSPTEARFHDMEPETDVLEVWFAGCHCDVGGGAVKNEVRHKLAQVPLRWMIRQCFEADTGIIFKADRLAEEGLDIGSLTPVYQPPSHEIVRPSEDLIERWKSGNLPKIEKRSRIFHFDGRTPSSSKHLAFNKDDQTLENGWLPEQTEDWFDALAGVNDMLKISKTWWILEVIPIKIRVQEKHPGEAWKKLIRPNMGRYRPVQEPLPNLHWTVQHRMDEIGYKTKIRLDRNAKWNIAY